MKNRILVILIAVLCLLLPAAALAESATGFGERVAVNDVLAAYVDGNGRLRLAGNDQPVTQTQAKAVVSIDPYRLIFLSGSENGNKLISLELTGFSESVLASDVRAACMGQDGCLYYISSADRTQLHAVNFETGASSVVYTASEELDRLFVSEEGLVATYVENAGAIFRSDVTGLFAEYGGAIPDESTMTEEYQLYIANGSELYLFRTASNAADLVDANVYDYALLNGKVYYLANMGSAIRLKSYDPATMEWKVLGTPEISLENQLAASQTRLFTLGSDNVVYEINAQSGELKSFLSLQPSSYQGKLPSDGDWKIDSFSIEAMSGRLIVYANISEANKEPSFTFMEFTTDVNDNDGRYVLVESIPLEGEETAWDLLEPAKLYSPLRRGQRGDAVREMQQPLYDLGYYDYYVDGIFGSRTERAIRLLQDDLGMTVNGIADEALQKLILGGTLSAYDPYRALNRGDSGLRVQRMQQRLRDLGYLADAADGIFGPRTQQAVQLFQRENGISVNENATRDTLVALYAVGASKCSSYIELRLGDTGSRVRTLNRRLKELYYLEGSAGSTYTKATANAVRRFQSQVGLSITGEASVAVQQRLFAENAPEYLGYITLRRGDENSRVQRLQRRLAELEYFSGKPTGYFGKATQNAVKLFQQRAGLRPTGVADVTMQELLFSPDAPKYVKPTIIGTPALSVDCYEKFEKDLCILTDRCSASGYVTFSWQTEGDVESYNVTITDETGAKYLDQNTLLTMTGVSIDALTVDRVYVLTVTAKPQDGNPDHVTTASLRFKRINTPVEPPVIGTITEVSASVEPVTREENGISYVRPGDITFRWYAIGDVASYAVEIRDSNEKICLSTNTTDEQAAIRSNVMTEGQVYTLYVNAIPTNGTLENAVCVTRKFALDDQIKPVPTVSAPVVTVDGATPDENGSYLLDDAGATFRWNAVENAEQYYIEIRDDANALFSSETTTATGYVLNTASMSRGKSYVLSVTAIPAGGTVAQGATTSTVIRIREDETIVQLPAPVLSIQGLQPAADGIVYADNASLTFQWTAVESAAAYNVVVRDNTQAIVSENTVMDLTNVFDGASLTRGAVYTVSVMAVPEENVLAQGTPATLPFILNVQPTPPAVEPQPEPEVNDSDAQQTPPAVEPQPEPEVNDSVVQPAAPAAQTQPEPEAAAPDVQPAAAVVETLPVPVLGIDPFESCDGSVYTVAEGPIALSWMVEGYSCTYQAEIIEASDVVRASMTTQETGASIHSNQLTPDVVYTLRVTAIPDGGTLENGTTAELFFLKKTPEIPETPSDENAVEPTDEAVTVPDEVPAEEPVSGGTEIPAVDLEEDPVADITAPSLSIEPIAETVDSVNYVQEGTLLLRWFSEGDVAGYFVQILDSNGVCASQETTAQSTEISTSNMEPGQVYTLQVIAVPANGSLEDGSVSEVKFALKPVEAAAPVDEPAQNPLPDAASDFADVPDPEVVPEPVDEPDVEPAVEPEPEPVVEPEVEPTEEPAPEPTPEPVVESKASFVYPDDWNIALTPDSNQAMIEAVQQKLVELKWLQSNHFTAGSLDDATIQAVIAFQTYCNDALGSALIPCAVENPSIGSDTLLLLMNPTETEALVAPNH